MSDLQDSRWSDAIHARYSTPYIMTIRPVIGDPDLALIVEDHPEGARGQIWRAGEQVSDVLPFPVSMGAILTSDGQWVIDLDDGGGSEVGSLVAISISGDEVIPLTSGREPYVLRGLTAAYDGSAIVATVVDEEGFHVLRIPARPWSAPEVVFSSRIEAWYGQASRDGSLISVDTTDHCPGIRRPALTVVDSRTGETVAVLNDLPDGPLRAVRFSTAPDDDRVLVNTERTGFARPAIWNPRTGARTDFDLPDLDGDVIPLDWHAETQRMLAVHVHDGEHTLLEIAESGEVRELMSGGSFANPDVANLHPFYWASYFAPDGTVRAVRSRWDAPIHVLEIGRDGHATTLIEPAPVPRGVPFTSTMVESADGTRVQVWLGVPAGGTPLGTVLEVHGGPNLVAVDAYNPSAQAWIDAGFAYASLNYRGSVTFGRAFREGFWGVGGDREIEDVEAAVRWLRTQGLAERASTFITGASFGGHLTLLSVGRLPDLFAGGLAQVAVAEWSAAINAMNPAVRSVWSSWVPPEMVSYFSALTYVDAVRASVWINQGSIDTRTPIVGVQEYVDTMARRGGDIVLDVFEGGHEPTGLELLEHTQLRMTDLARRAIQGIPWRQ